MEETKKISSLTGIGMDELSHLEIASFDDVALLRDDEVQGLPNRQSQKLNALKAFLYAGNEITASTTMMQILRSQNRSRKRSLGEILVLL